MCLYRGRNIGEAGVGRGLVALTPRPKKRFEAGYVAGAKTGESHVYPKRKRVGCRCRSGRGIDAEQTVHGLGKPPGIAECREPHHLRRPAHQSRGTPPLVPRACRWNGDRGFPRSPRIPTGCPFPATRWQLRRCRQQPESPPIAVPTRARRTPRGQDDAARSGSPRKKRRHPRGRQQSAGLRTRVSKVSSPQSVPNPTESQIGYGSHPIVAKRFPGASE